MTLAADFAPATAQDRIASFVDMVGDVPLITDRGGVRKRSQDFYWYSPILKPLLADKTADIVAVPRGEADVVRIAAACARLRLPLTVRGAGTGNYGQAVPLERGVLVDMTAMDRVKWVKPGLVRVEAGKLMLKLDREVRPTGWELRMYPSTKRTATIGGFIAGGTGGVGTVSWGGLREPGNINAVRIVTCEETPRVLELRGNRANLVNRAYGTTGIVTELEFPLAPAWPWRDVVVTFADFMQAARFGQAVLCADGLVKKLVTPVAWPIPATFPRLKNILPEGRHIVICMIAATSMAAFRDMVAEHGGDIEIDEDAVASEEEGGRLPLYEYTWNHTTLHFLKVDRSITYLQCLCPPGNNLELVERMHRHFGDEVLQHLEMIRFDGKPANSALPIVRYTTPERLNAIIAWCEANGIYVANPHTWTLEDGTRYKTVPVDQHAFKAEVDPYGLLNPGKMRSYVPVAR